MTVEQIDNLQEIYARVGRIILEIGEEDDWAAKSLKEAQGCITSAVTAVIESSFRNGDLAIAEL